MDQPSKRPVTGAKLWPEIALMLGLQNREHIQSATININEGLVTVDLREVIYLDGVPLPSTHRYKLIPIEADDLGLVDTTSIGDEWKSYSMAIPLQTAPDAPQSTE